MVNLAPWYYRKLLVPNALLDIPYFFEVKLLNNVKNTEAIISLKDNLRPKWLSKSEIYRNCDGSGTSLYKNIAVYKAISEALERMAFYEMIDTREQEYSFHINPTTTGMAAFPHYNASKARQSAKLEAIERWAIHEFNRGRIPLKKISTNINNLKQFELITPFPSIKVTLLEYKSENFYAYGFAGGLNLSHSFEKALIELDRNLRVLSTIYKKNEQESTFTNIIDQSLVFFSTPVGNEVFHEKINRASLKIVNLNPKIICDKELKGEWSKHTKVWRYLFEDSYFDTRSDINFFMF